jgi:phage N-6-adenine-methyltransferase
MMTTKSMPIQGTDLKQGVYRTDPEFMEYIRGKYKIIGDLAAGDDNFQAPLYLTEKEDALSVNWREFYEICMASEGEGYLWLNPPYDDIGAWAQKCAYAVMEGVKILFLVPAGVGTNWYRKYVEDFARVDLLNGRLVFEFLYPEDYMDKKTTKANALRLVDGLDPIPCAKAGKRNTDPYPKDMILGEYNIDIPLEQRLARTLDWKTYL